MKKDTSPLVRSNWYGTLNEANIEAIVERLRRLLTDQYFVIVSHEYIESTTPRLTVRTDCYLNSEWTDKSPEQIRLWPGSDVEHRGEKWYSPAHLSFSAGGYCWCGMTTAPGEEKTHNNYKYALVEFDDSRDGESFSFTARAPAGHLHKHVFAVQKHSGKREE